VDPTPDVGPDYTFPAERIADWDVAVDIARHVSGPGPQVVGSDRDRLRADLAELTAEAESAVAAFTGLAVDGPPSRAWVMGRGDWVRRNTVGLQRLMEPLAARLLESKPNRSAFARKALGVQIGTILGYVSRRVLGQYDVFLPPDDDGLIYFVGPNLVDVERRFALDPRSFRLWVAIHEVTHRAQFGVAPWLRGYLGGLVDEYLGSISLEHGALMGQLREAADELQRGRGSADGLGGILLLLTPPQREIFAKTQAMMSLLEGHASYVMNEVADGLVDDLPRLRRALAARRSTKGVEKAFQRAIAFDQKVAQYDAGERFVREVVARGGRDAINQVWASSANLPTREEVADPSLWVSRVGG
jgi:coenzyme F420 biosynthesis associated uncharacterized protein